MDRLLAIDVGNTHTVVGVFVDEKIVARFRITSNRNRTNDELGVLLHQMLYLRLSEIPDFSGSALCSVVPDITDTTSRAITNYFDTTPVVINKTNYDDIGIDVQYRNIDEVGPDRIVNSLAARELYGHPAIVVDFGTATTFDIISENGAYIGGVIMPGLEVAARNLFDSAARLSPVRFAVPENIIGKDTSNALQTGIMYGTIDAVDGMIVRIIKEMGSRPNVIATGGLASVLSPHSKHIKFVDKDLTLKGIALALGILQNNNEK